MTKTSVAPLDIEPDNPLPIGSTSHHNFYVIIDIAEANEWLNRGEDFHVVASGHPWHIEPSLLDTPYKSDPRRRTRRDTLHEFLLGLNGSGRRWGYAVQRSRKLEETTNHGR